VSGNKIGVQMSFKDVANLGVVFFRGFQIDVYVPLRINHDSFTLRCQYVGSVRQTAQVKLFEIHSRGLIENSAKDGALGADHHNPPIKLGNSLHNA
jgi:hypothetical protein